MIYVIGYGNHAKMVASVLETMKLKYKKISEIYEKKNNNYIDEKICKYKKNIFLHIAIGDNSIRKKTYNFFKKKNYKFKSLIHSTSIKSKFVLIKENVFIGAGSIINNDVKIYDNCIINTGTIVEHDTIIQENVHLAPGVKIMGGCIVGKNSFVGAGTVVSNNLKIANNCVLGAGSVVIKNLKSSGLYAGIPTQKKR